MANHARSIDPNMVSPQILFLRPFVYRFPTRAFSTTGRLFSAGGERKFKLAIVGGGSGGSAISSMFASSLGKQNVAVIEPSDVHYYQPLWTLVGSGIKTFEQSAKPMSDVLKSSTWIKDQVAEFKPSKNSLVIGSGETIKYDYLVIACGLQHRYDRVKGLKDALDNYPEVCTNYDPKYVNKTLKAIENFKEGTALFTMNVPIKCPGAPQKIMYLADDYFRKHGKREKSKFIYCTALGAMLGAPHYAKILHGICQKRNMETHFLTKLIEIDPKAKLATFDIIDKQFAPTGQKKQVKYDFIHVGPPFSTPDVLSKCKELCDQGGWLNVDKHTLQSHSFPNVFGIGDCTNLPNAKTGAAVAAEAGVLKRNLKSVMENKKPTSSYNGYSSCPVPTSYNTAILAEFDYNWEPMETFPIDQGKERRIWYFFKAEMIPVVYWQGLIKGIWEGPSRLRKLFHLGFSK